MEMISVLPPGLYEAVITEVEPETERPELIEGNHLLRLETRTLDHIRALGANAPEDERRFATAARVSDSALELYRALAGPAVRAMATEQNAELQRRLHPNRLRFALFSDENPAMRPVKVMAEQARAHRKPVSSDNPLLQMERAASEQIAFWLDLCGQVRDVWTETFFLNTYGLPVLQAAVGLGPQLTLAPRRIERDLAREVTESRLRAELETQFERGGPAEAALRALIYVRLPAGSVDERGFTMVQAIRAAQPADRRLTLTQLKDVLRTQYLLLRLDEQRAIQAIPRLLPQDQAPRRAAIDALRQVLGATGSLDPEERRRLDEVEPLFGVETPSAPRKEAAHA